MFDQSKCTELEFFPPSVRSKETSETKAPQLSATNNLFTAQHSQNHVQLRAYGSGGEMSWEMYAATGWVSIALCNIKKDAASNYLLFKPELMQHIEKDLTAREADSLCSLSKNIKCHAPQQKHEQNYQESNSTWYGETSNYHYQLCCNLCLTWYWVLSILKFIFISTCFIQPVDTLKYSAYFRIKSNLPGFVFYYILFLTHLLLHLSAVTHWITRHSPSKGVSILANVYHWWLVKLTLSDQIRCHNPNETCCFKNLIWTIW